uniref:Aminotransferase-like protein n=1 Tax=Oryza sativa subsp. japonica TaxID=39947 RepID=Q6ERF6_ORYSJ|nr:aminotransferase-like protein [Oryza sativa Japonica Group]
MAKNARRPPNLNVPKCEKYRREGYPEVLARTFGHRFFAKNFLSAARKLLALLPGTSWQASSSNLKRPRSVELKAVDFFWDLCISEARGPVFLLIFSLSLLPGSSWLKNSGSSGLLITAKKFQCSSPGGSAFGASTWRAKLSRRCQGSAKPPGSAEPGPAQQASKFGQGADRHLHPPYSCYMDVIVITRWE